jgi:hypothetical protein
MLTSNSSSQSGATPPYVWPRASDGAAAVLSQRPFTQRYRVRRFARVWGGQGCPRSGLARAGRRGAGFPGAQAFPGAKQQPLKQRKHEESTTYEEHVDNNPVGARVLGCVRHLEPLAGGGAGGGVHPRGAGAEDSHGHGHGRGRPGGGLYGDGRRVGLHRTADCDGGGRRGERSHRRGGSDRRGW